MSWTEGLILAVAAVLVACALLPALRAYRSLLLGSSVLMLITAFIPRPDNTLAQHLLPGFPALKGIPAAVIAIVWWTLGAWLLTSLLDLILRRTLFPSDDQPHARRLFADLGSGLVYVIAFVGIMDTVFKQPVSAVLATSGVLAVVLGFALQNTLADVFAGLALNIERPFSAGDWVTVAGMIEGQVIEINWRATRIKTIANDMNVIPNSVLAKAVVKNHRRLNSPLVCTVGVVVSHRVTPDRVIEALIAAANQAEGLAPGFATTAYAREFAGDLISYEVYFGIDEFSRLAKLQSQVVRNIAVMLDARGIALGTPVTDVRIVQQDLAGLDAPGAPTLAAAKGTPEEGPLQASPAA